MYIFVSDAKYTEFSNNQFKNMEYIREKERGFDYIENIYVPGTFEVEIPENVTKKIYVYVTLDLEDKDVKNIYEKEKSCFGNVRWSGFFCCGNFIKRTRL